MSYFSLPSTFILGFAKCFVSEDFREGAVFEFFDTNFLEKICLGA
jgi:hypothetical protein